MTKDANDFAKEILEMIPSESLSDEQRSNLLSGITKKIKEYGEIERRLLRKRINAKVNQLEQTNGMVKIVEVTASIEEA